MPVVKCSGCKRETNSAVSDYWMRLANGFKTASWCLKAWDKKKDGWVKSCYHLKKKET